MLNKIGQVAEQVAASAILDKYGQFAERAATRASRRNFLGWMARSAAASAAALGGLLALTYDAQAAGDEPLACDASLSSPSCFNRKNGDPCTIDRLRGKCINAPSCFCAVKRPRR